MWDITGTMWLVTNIFIYGLKGAWLPWLWPTFNQVILMVYLSVWIRRSGVLTGAEWITTRFGKGRGSELSRLIIVVFALVSVVGFIVYDFRGMGKFSSTFLPWKISANTYAVIVMGVTAVYVILGGMLSVVITDLLQFAIMAVCSILIGVIAVHKVSPELLQSIVPAGWDNLFFGWHLGIDWSGRLPVLNEQILKDGYSLFGLFFMAMLFKGMLVSIAGPAPNYDMQRILAAKTPREAAFMSGIVSVALLPRWIMIAGITALGLAFLSPEWASVTRLSQVDFEMVLPFVIRQFIPAGLVGLLLAGLLAAFMSTFSATLNAGAAYLVNDLYKRHINPGAAPRHYVRAGYAASGLILAAGFTFGFFASSVNEVTQWIVNGLWGGYTAANVLKWHWYRLNGFGYFWGMTAGIASALVIPACFPSSGLGSLSSFPIILAVSGTACVLGSLLSKPEDDETLIRFYAQVRPWGWWGPVHAKAVAQDPSFRKNKNFGRDMLNCLVAIAGQFTLVTIPLYLVFGNMRGVWISVLVLLVTAGVLKVTWYGRLEGD